MRTPRAPIRPLHQTVIALGAISLAVVLAVAVEPGGGSIGRRPSTLPSASAGAIAVPEAPLGGSQSGPPSGASTSGVPPWGVPPEEELDTAEGLDSRAPVAIPAQIELYAGVVSITAGQPLQLHVSTPAPNYHYSIERLDASLPAGGEVVARSVGRVGHDYGSLVTFDTLNRTARANWPVTDTVHSTGWTPGVYVVTARDSRGTVGQAIFVVRTPTLLAGAPAFVFTALTYEAYNLWGGANLYRYAQPRAVRVSFERPYLQGSGNGFWARDDDRILAWLQRRGLPLQYTTDYDLAVHPPAVAPRLLIIPRHAEYVTGSLRDWVEQHVNAIGDMNLLSYGSNGFYWQVRLAPPRTAGAPMDIVCYKSATADALAAANPGRATGRWRQPPVNRPEGAVLGAQYAKVLGTGYSRYDLTVTAGMPPELRAGTGWQPGTVIHGLLLGEGDLVYPGSGGVAIMDGRAADTMGAAVSTSVTIRTSPAGAKVFDAGTFGWADGFSPAKVNLGVPATSFERFNRNLLSWLGFPASS